MGLRDRLRPLLRHPAVRWAERIFWVVLVLFAIQRLGPQLSALTGIGPVLGSAPEFTLTTLDGRQVTSASLAGKVVVVNFWATWCTPCRIEIPSLQKLHERRADEGVVVLGIATDAQGSAVVAPYLAERGVSYPVGMATSELRRAFGGISALPTTFIIDRDGMIRHRVFGLFAPPAMSAGVRRLLREDAGGAGGPP